jgi:hypothetical protein
MSDPNYNIQYQNGASNLDIAPATYDSSTSLDLFGKNATTYGDGFWSNIVHLLENFYNENEPRNAIVGQLWFNGTELKLCTAPASTKITADQYKILSASTTRYRSDAQWATINTVDSVNANAIPKVDEYVRKKYVDNRTNISPSEPDITALSAGAIWYDSVTGICKILVDTGATKFWDPLNTIFVSNKPLSEATLGQLYFNTNLASFGLHVCTGIDPRSNTPIWTNATSTNSSPVVTPIIGSAPAALANNQLYVEGNSLMFSVRGIGSKLVSLTNGTLQVPDPLEDTDVANKQFVLANVPVKFNTIPNSAKAGELYYTQPQGYTAKTVLLKTDDALISLLTASDVLTLPVNASVPNTTAAGSLCFTSNDNTLNLYAYGRWNGVPTTQTPNVFNSVNRFTQTIISTTTDAPFNVQSNKLVANLNVGYLNNVQVTGVAVTGSVLTALDDTKAVWVAQKTTSAAITVPKKVFTLDSTTAGLPCITVSANVNISNDIAIGVRTFIYNSKSSDVSITATNILARLIGSVTSVRLVGYGVCEITCIDTNTYLITGDIRA